MAGKSLNGIEEEILRLRACEAGAPVRRDLPHPTKKQALSVQTRGSPPGMALSLRQAFAEQL
jgi:hypothetical protein